MRLLDILFPPRSDEQLVRLAGPRALIALLERTTVYKTQPSTTVLLPYRDPLVRAALHEAKYHGSSEAFTLLSETLTEYLTSPARGPVVLVPVPLGRARLRERGFNQVEEVAHRAAKRAEVRVDASLLRRVRETASQVSLPRKERKENMRDAFGAARPLTPEERAIQYIVLDDVLTTGATLQAALDALKDAGAKHVSALALAH